MLHEDSKKQIEEIVRRVVREELDALRVAGSQPFRISLTLPEVASATGYSLESIRKAIKRNELLPAYANTKPVVMVEEVVRWMRGLPIDASDL